VKPRAGVQSFDAILCAETGLAARDRVAPSVSWTAMCPGYGGTWTGPDAVRRHLCEPRGRDGRNCLVTPDACVVEEPIVVAFGTSSGIDRDGSQSIVAPFVHRWEVIDGTVKSVQQYPDTALRAAAHT
jgi:uncharacterized protein